MLCVPCTLTPNLLSKYKAPAATGILNIEASARVAPFPPTCSYVSCMFCSKKFMMMQTWRTANLTDWIFLNLAYADDTALIIKNIRSMHGFLKALLKHAQKNTVYISTNPNVSAFHLTPIRDQNSLMAASSLLSTKQNSLVAPSMQNAKSSTRFTPKLDHAWQLSRDELFLG